MTYDILIIGGGVFGTAIAERLSRTTASVCLVEKQGDVAEGASKGNAGVTSSYFSAPGTLDARLVSASAPRWEDVCRRLNVPFQRIGSLVAALDDDEVAVLHTINEEALACGARAELVSGERARSMEPLLSPHCQAALYVPDDGVIDPMRLTCAFAELAATNGCTIKLNTPIIGFEKSDGQLHAAVTPFGKIRARHFINAAGLHADTVSHLAGGDRFRMWPRKGQYWILDRAFGARLNHVVNAVPSIPEGISKGIHVILTSRGSVLVGPTADDEDDRYDTATDGETLTYAFERAKRLVPSISLNYAIKSYSGLRPACDTPFFVCRDERVPNLIHSVSRSIGVSSSLGVADYVCDLLRESGLHLEDTPDAADSLPGLLNLRHCEHPEELTDVEDGSKTVICVCEQVTAAEIEAALTCRVPARSIDGVWKRTGATGGRCQGSLCLTGVTFLCSAHMNCPPDRVPVKDRTEMGVGRVEPS